MRIGPGLFRLLVALVVVLHHSTPLRLGAWAVFIFFAISGFWISAKCASLNGEIVGLLRFWGERWWRLTPVFLFCSLLAWGLAVLGWAPPPANSQMWWLRQLPIVGAASAGRILPVSWTLDVEMQFYLVAPFLVAIWRRTADWLALLIAGAMLGWSALHAFRGVPLDTPRLDLQLAFFLMGFGLQRFDWRPSHRQAWLAAGACAALFLIVAALPATRDWVWRRGGGNASGISQVSVASVWWTSVCGCLLMMPFLAVNLRQPSNSRDRLFGQIAYPLFLFHWIARDVYYRLVDWDHPWWQNGLLLAGNVMFALLGSVVIWWLIDRPAEALRRRWMSAFPNGPG